MYHKASRASGHPHEASGNPNPNGTEHQHQGSSRSQLGSILIQNAAVGHHERWTDNFYHIRTASRLQACTLAYQYVQPSNPTRRNLTQNSFSNAYTKVCTSLIIYLNVVSVVVGSQVDVCCPCGGDDGEPLWQVAGPQHGVQEIVPPAVSLQKAAEALVSEANKQRTRDA